MAIDFGNKIYVLDGAMGTMLQSAGMAPNETTTQFGYKHPEILTDIHSQYIKAGSDIIYASTFGINRFKINEIEGNLDDGVKSAMAAAQTARDNENKDVKIALGIGPLGELLEPMGTLAFEDAYEAFSEIVIAGRDYADIAVIETMTDLYEVKAAVLAVKENSDLPVIVSMTFEENMRTFTGVSLESMALTLEGLGVDAMGINCSL
ncbi:MAG: homocysteine S-methyltransferase family protein, partial [Anaerovoracaceae bacterium]